MDPYILVCRDREYELKKFDNYFYPEENEEESSSKDRSFEIKKLINSILEIPKYSYKLPNVMFKSYDSIVACNIDIIFELTGIKYHTTMKRYDTKIKFCELGGNSMSEYFLWRFYNSEGYGVMTSEEYKKIPLSSTNYKVILPPLKNPEIVPNELIPGNDYLTKTLFQESGGVDIMIINKKLSIDYILEMIRKCLNQGGKCIIKLSDFDRNIQNLFLMFKKIALVKPLSSSSYYLVLIDKKEEKKWVGEEGSINNDKIVEYLRNSLEIFSKEKKEVLYYLNRANIHFCIY